MPVIFSLHASHFLSSLVLSLPKVSQVQYSRLIFKPVCPRSLFSYWLALVAILAPCINSWWCTIQCSDPVRTASGYHALSVIRGIIWPHWTHKKHSHTESKKHPFGFTKDSYFLQTLIYYQGQFLVSVKLCWSQWECCFPVCHVEQLNVDRVQTTSQLLSENVSRPVLTEIPQNIALLLRTCWSHTEALLCNRTLADAHPLAVTRTRHNCG